MQLLERESGEVTVAVDARQLDSLVGDVTNYFDNPVLPCRLNILFCTA